MGMRPEEILQVLRRLRLCHQAAAKDRTTELVVELAMAREHQILLGQETMQVERVVGYDTRTAL